jgi:hypothetical protein
VAGAEGRTEQTEAWPYSAAAIEAASPTSMASDKAVTAAKLAMDHAHVAAVVEANGTLG